jgi:hypothetical protein
MASLGQLKHFLGLSFWLRSTHFKNPKLAAAGANLKDYILRIFFWFNEVTNSNMEVNTVFIKTGN